jgi:hypothetical protein
MANALTAVEIDGEVVGWVHETECKARLCALGAEPQRDGIAGFDRPEDGSERRYTQRSAERPWAAHTFWWLVHNVVAHSLIAVVPRRPCFDFHDWTSRKMHGS